MNILLVMTIVFGTSGETQTLEIGLVSPEYCDQLGQLVSVDVLQTTSAVAVAYSCTEQAEG